MKKKYVSPEMTIVEMFSGSELLAGSAFSQSDFGGGHGSISGNSGFIVDGRGLEDDWEDDW